MSAPVPSFAAADREMAKQAEVERRRMTEPIDLSYLYRAQQLTVPPSGQLQTRTVWHALWKCWVGQCCAVIFRGQTVLLTAEQVGTGDAAGAFDPPTAPPVPSPEEVAAVSARISAIQERQRAARTSWHHVHF